MKNVLVLIDKLGRGGAERLVADFAPRVDKAAYKVSVCSLGATTAMADEMRAAGIDLTVLGLSKWDPLALSKVLKTVRDREVDLIHSHLGKSIVLGWLASRRAKTRFIAHEHVGPMWPHFGGGPLHRIENWLMCRATLFCMLRADAVIAVAGPTRDWIVERRARLAEHTVVVTNGINLDGLGKVGEDRDRARAEVRLEFGLPPDCPLVFGAASFRFVKRWDLFVKTAADVLKERPEVQFLGAGSGPLHAELIELCRSLGIAENVHLIGVRGDVPRLMAAADFFLMPTSMECDPIVAKEALAMSLPIVGSDIPPLRENITDGAAGFLVTFGDVEGMARKCLRLLSDDGLLGSMRQKAHELARERFSIEKCVGEIEAVYARVLEER